MIRNEIIQKCIETLKGFPAIQIATLFGSIANDRLTNNSDIDIAVAAEKPLSIDEKVNLHLALSKSIPREIDLIDLHIINGLILQNALCRGSIIKNSSPIILANLLKKMWYNQADMMPLTKQFLKHNALRFVNG